MKKTPQHLDSLNIPDIRFLEGCVDECDINGDMLVREYTFPYGRRQWNPKHIGEQ